MTLTRLMILTIISILLFFTITTEANGFCNITATYKDIYSIKANHNINIPFLTLTFPQSTGFPIDTVASSIPNEIVTGLSDISGQVAQTPTLDSICIYQQVIDLVPYLQLVFLPQAQVYNTSVSGQINTLWTAIQTPTSWVYRDTTYLKGVDKATSSRPTALLRLVYCDAYQSLQDANMECPITTPSKDEHDQSLNKQSGLLFMGSILLTLLSIALFFYVYNRYERQADYKHALAIKRTNQLKAAQLATPQQAAEQRQYDRRHSITATSSEVENQQPS